MSDRALQAIRGMNDILPEAIAPWHFLEKTFRRLAKSYGYGEIRLPIVENLELFKRTIGEVTDIVEKEMYAFEDRNGDWLALRPEGTAGCVRAGIEHGMLYNQIQKVWYQGPMFRHERPQKGRYRQFYQVGIEAFGLAGPDVDAEMILMTARLWRELGLENKITLQLNSLGSTASRQAYRDRLVEYFNQHLDGLDEDSQRRLSSNPLRILDSKNPAMADLIAKAPNMLEHLDDDSKAHFQGLCDLLDSAGVTYTVNPRLVRGLDYYCYTVFEWVTDALGSQGTVCAGGRYDGLVAMLGGATTPAMGCALGLDRLVLLMGEEAYAEPIHAYLIHVGEAAKTQALNLAEELRDKLPGLRVQCHLGTGNYKNQFKKADKSGTRVALILGEDEMAKNEITVKYLREEKAQTSLGLQQAMALLESMIQEENAS